MEKIVGVKEASGNISQVARLMALADGCVDLYSGNDDQIVPILSLGGKGVISVLSNVAPQQTHDICEYYFKGETQKSMQEQLRAISLCDALFCEVNPIPVKEALNICGYNFGEPRLPLIPMSKEKRKILKECMEK